MSELFCQIGLDPPPPPPLTKISGSAHGLFLTTGFLSCHWILIGFYFKFNKYFNWFKPIATASTILLSCIYFKVQCVENSVDLDQLAS